MCPCVASPYPRAFCSPELSTVCVQYYSLGRNGVGTGRRQAGHQAAAGARADGSVRNGSKGKVRVTLVVGLLRGTHHSEKR